MFRLTAIKKYLFLQILLAFIWLRRYPTMQHIATHFGIPVSCVHRIIHKILPFLHVYLVPKYITWHTDRKWNSLRGELPDWPRVVAILDGTPFRISKPKGNIQRIFYRRDRHIFFLNWLVIIDVKGLIVFSRPGFVGHLHDSTCYRYMETKSFSAKIPFKCHCSF